MERNKEMVTVKSYDGKLVRIPEEKLDEYLENQRLIKKYLDDGMNVEEIKVLLKMENKN